MTLTPRGNGRGSMPLAWVLCASGALLMAATPGRGQERPASGTSNDPRVGLEAGLRDAGEAIRNLELVETLPKPEGFFDPEAPAGHPTPPEEPEE
ncbi:MAG TPA: hypothetical protein QGF05_13765, partial [Dehalococcoidia bacterium]|nr:hypothetical protein [Dehalococcoidia bacterium]